MDEERRAAPGVALLGDQVGQVRHRQHRRGQRREQERLEGHAQRVDPGPPGRPDGDRREQDHGGIQVDEGHGCRAEDPQSEGQATTGQAAGHRLEHPEVVEQDGHGDGQEEEGQGRRQGVEHRPHLAAVDQPAPHGHRGGADGEEGPGRAPHLQHPAHHRQPQQHEGEEDHSARMAAGGAVADPAGTRPGWTPSRVAGPALIAPGGAAMTEPHILAIDLGTGGPKVAFVDLRGRIVAHEVETTSLILLPPGRGRAGPRRLVAGHLRRGPPTGRRRRPRRPPAWSASG